MDVSTETLALAGTAAVAVASLLANVLPKHTIVGKVCNFIALNFWRVFSPTK